MSDSRENESRRVCPAPRRPAQPRGNARGDATRLRILLAAERLFADGGLGVPLVDVGVAAGQRNNVAVRYHFGNRDGLLRAILDHRAPVSHERRIAMVAEMMARRELVGVIDLVRAYVEPLAGHLARNNHYIAFLARYLMDGGGYVGLNPAIGPGTVQSLRRVLGRVLPDHPAEVLDERWSIMMSAALQSLARCFALMVAERNRLPPVDRLEDLIRVLAAGIEAPFD